MNVQHAERSLEAHLFSCCYQQAGIYTDSPKLRPGFDDICKTCPLLTQEHTAAHVAVRDVIIKPVCYLTESAEPKI